MRNSEWGMEGWMSIPHSTFRTPHWGWEDAGAPHRSDSQRTLLHPGRQFAGGWGGLVCVSWVRPARGAIPGEAARARRWASLSGRAGGAVPVLSERESDGATRWRKLDDARGSARRDRGVRAGPRLRV